MKVTSRLVLNLLLPTLLASCGGGGGDNPDTDPPIYVPTPAAVTPANQVAVAQAAVGGSQALVLAQPLASGPSGPSAPPASALALAAPPPRSAAALLAGSARRTLAATAVAPQSAGASRRSPLATTTESDTCGASGSITTTMDDRDNSSGLTVGDVVTVAFAQCRDSASDLIDGTVTATITSLGPNTSSTTTFSASLVFGKVTSSFGATSGVIDGTVDAAAAVTSSSFQLTLTVGDKGLGIAISSASFSDGIAYAPGMRIAIGESDSGAGSSTVSLDGSFSTRSIGGSVSVATLQPFRQVGSDSYPSSGQMLITGAGGSRLRLTALDRTQLRIELDANGDGSYEASQVLPWSTLSPA